MTWLIKLGNERLPMDPRHVDFVVERARAWHKTPQQAFDRIVNAGLKSLLGVISAAKATDTQSTDRD